ncbi:tyrosine-type recombinase/integrase [Agitococcus lubricus]|uniref:Integrase n=1 Tax=Agitococcus lubricus TaxID=1077255 RepID=A0A2T5IX82_9GAMM|nr:integrase arm-type DNA-binding domain-containing protein [Agitococcus lubricus]PTQ88460.1 integrase [Agitococcus lubricus]
MPLTDIQIKKAKYTREDGKPERLTDGGGMYLELSAKGGKWWRWKYRFGGKEKRLSLGTYPDVSLKAAREKRDEAKRLLADNIDPAVQRKEQKRQTIILTEDTFEAIAREWLNHMSEEWTSKHLIKTTRILEKEAFPILGKYPIRTIKALQIIEMIRITQERGVYVTASKVYQWTGAIFRFAIATGRADVDPTPACRGAVKTRPVQHMTRINEKEIPELLSKIKNYDGEIVTKLAIQFMALTFVRTSEMIGAKWDEIDLDKAEWRIPAERMKMRTVHIVPLAKQTVSLLEELALYTRARTYLFTSSRVPSKHMSNNTILFALYRMGYHGRMTGHGFRGLASTILNEHGFRADVIERQLAHSERDSVRAAYNHAEYLPERRKMMQYWADFLESKIV